MKVLNAYDTFTASDIYNRASDTCDMSVVGTTVECTNVSQSKVRNVLGESISNLVGLCESSLVNKWSYFGTFNVFRNQTTGEIYFESKTPCKLGNFAGYNHDAVPSTSIEVVSVRERETNTYLSSPFNLWYNFSYDIQVNAVKGDIPSDDIDSRTVQTKLTSGDGYGGIAIAEPLISNNLLVDSSNVISVPTSTSHTFVYIVQNTGTLTYPFDVYYCEKSFTDYYALADLFIEDLSYRDIFSVSYVGISLTSLRLRYIGWVGYTEDVVVFDCNIENTSGRDILDTRITYKYRSNSGSWNYLYDYDVDITSTYNAQRTKVLDPFNGITQGNNTIDCYIYIEIYDNTTSAYRVIMESNVTDTFYINLT